MPKKSDTPPILEEKTDDTANSQTDESAEFSSSESANMASIMQMLVAQNAAMSAQTTATNSQMTAMKQQIVEMNQRFDAEIGNVKSEPQTTTARTHENTSAPHVALATADPNNLITEQEQKTSVSNANKAVVKLDGKCSGQVFKSRFVDYLTTLGLAKALQSTRVTQVNVDTKAESEVRSESKVAQLRANPSHAMRWQEAHTTLKGSLSDELYTYMVINPSKDVSKVEDFFDLWERVMQKIGDTPQFCILTVKWTALSKLKFKIGDTVSIFKSKVESIANEINTLAGQTNITNAAKCWHFWNGIETSDFKDTFEQPLKEMKPTLGNMDFVKVTNKFYEYAPKDDNGMELPMAADEQAEPHAELAMYTGKNNTPSPYYNKQCEFCHRRGHTVEECRQKNRTRNDNPIDVVCRDFARTGNCGWQKRSGRPCKFKHITNTSNTSNPKSVPNETANLVQAFTAALVTLTANKRTQQQQPPQHQQQHQQPSQQQQPPPVQQGTAALAGIDMDNMSGILSLVDGLPSGWAGCGTAEILSDTETETEDTETDTADEGEMESDEDKDVPDTDTSSSNTEPPEFKYDTEEAKTIAARDTARQGFCGFIRAFFMIFFVTVWGCGSDSKSSSSQQRNQTRNTRKKMVRKQKKKQQLQEAAAMEVRIGDTSAGCHAVLLDSACSRSTTPNSSWLSQLRSTLVRNCGQLTADLATPDKKASCTSKAWM
jgi:hypothetical protein